MSSNRHIDKIIFLYLSGEADLEQIQELRKWLNSNPGNKGIFESITGFWNSSKIEIESGSKDAAFSDLLDRIKNQHKETKTRHLGSTNYPRPRRRWDSLGWVAAAVIVLCVFAVSIYMVINVKGEVPEQTIVQKQNEAGQKSMIKLPDGSTVWLNAGSSITYPETFENDMRKVTLNGEAFFDILKDEDRPFIVNAGDLNVSVLGTEFNVMAFPGDSLTNISLVSGEVQVNHIKSGTFKDVVYLQPGEEVKYNSQSGNIRHETFDVEYVTSWKEGVLILKDDSFSSFIRKLKSWYGVEIIVDGKPSQNFIVTGKFRNENMENVLKTLQFGRDFEFTIKGKVLTLKFE